MNREAEEFLSLPHLSLEDSFSFHCTRCGECCRNREDIQLSPYDLFRIYQVKGIQPKDFVENYCKVRVGTNSHLPSVHLRQVWGDCELYPFRRCLMQEGDLCTLQDCKPTVCSLYPLGRAFQLDTTEERKGKVSCFFILQEVSCGTKDHSQTVREWMGPLWEESMEAFQTWSLGMCTLLPLAEQLHKTLSFKKKKDLTNWLLSVLFMNYSPEDTFLPALTANLEKARRKLEEEVGRL